jgi:hypothetical protein
MKTAIEIINGINIFFEPIEEYISLKEMFPDDTEEQLNEIYNNNVIFCAKISGEIAGIELGSDYLGGCVYESYEDFYTKYKKDYYSDMVRNVIEEVEKNVPNIVNELINYNKLPQNTGMLGFSQEDINDIENN